MSEWSLNKGVSDIVSEGLWRYWGSWKEGGEKRSSFVFESGAVEVCEHQPCSQRWVPAQTLATGPFPSQTRCSL